MGLPLQSLCLSLFVLFALSGQAYGFGAGNIASLSRIEGQNWRHGDIEDTLLTLFLARVAGGRKFSKLDVKRVYFGNWLRDYSQAVDVGTVKYVSAEAIRILLWVLGFLSFGYGTREFEVTTERLGCYQPTEHIDNPLGYAEGDDARRYDRRLRGPVDEERELSIDPRTGLKSYIASEDMGIDTSAALVRRVLGRSIQLGRRYARSRKDEDLYEALRLLGTGLHCLEDYAAHSNYTELSLIEMGEKNIFPHVGRNAMIELPGARDYVHPIVTGTFGGVDFFHSVLGELSDKTTQSEIQSLEGVISQSENDSPSESLLQDLLNNIPSGLIGDSNAQASQMDDFKAKADEARRQNRHVTPREPEEWTRYLDDVQRQIYPVLEWHDELLKTINEAIEQIPVIPELIEQIQNQITVFVFSILAPYVLPIIKQVKAELQTGSSEVIQSSREQQHIVFNDDSSSDPTHSMLSKDHFSNVLNEPAGRIASQVVKWAVPQLMQCWDDDNVDIDRTLTRIITGVFHHPAQRQYGDDGAGDIRHIMFSTVEQWWGDKSDRERNGLRQQLSRDGVLEGRNHKEGVHDCGHGCGKPLALPNGRKTGGSNGKSHESDDLGLEKLASEAMGGGTLGGLVGGLVGGMGSMVLNESGSDGGNGSKRPISPKPRKHQQDNGDHEHRDRHNQHRGHHEAESYAEVRPPHHGEHRRPGEAPVYEGYYQEERRETYESGRHGYQRIETRFESGSGREQIEREHQFSHGGRRGDFEGHERPGHRSHVEGHGRRFEGGEDRDERRHHHHQRHGSPDARSDESDGGEKKRAHHHHREHRHHRRSGSEDSD